jgi:hypothetical protein
MDLQNPRTRCLPKVLEVKSIRKFDSNGIFRQASPWFTGLVGRVRSSVQSYFPRLETEIDQVMGKFAITDAMSRADQ